MIEVAGLEQHGHIRVEPSDDIFEELGNNTYDYKDLVSELIDNAVAAMRSDRRLAVEIEIHVDTDSEAQRFVIRDNGEGIPRDRLGPAISPAGIRSENSLNEHGLGMKQAVAGLGTLEYLATKTQTEDEAIAVKNFAFGDLTTYSVPFGFDSGTEISVVDLRPIVVTNPTSITRSLEPYLGARYRRFLRPDSKMIDISLRICREEDGTVTNSWDIAEVKPVYFHPSTRTNKAVIERFPLAGEGWRAELTMGYAPEQDTESEELGIDKPNKFHPYHVSLSNQGLDVIRHDRVILFHQLSELDIVRRRHNDYNAVRGEIDLLEGFATAITKNSMIHDRPFQECIAQVRDVLSGRVAGPEGEEKNYLRRRTYPEEIPEELLRDRLAAWLESNPLSRKEEVRTEYVVGGIEGFIDILADNEAWEIKTQKASALDVYQLFMYMDVQDIGDGYLVANGFTGGATVARDHIEQKHGKNIRLAILDDFPILRAPDESEREEYY